MLNQYIKLRNLVILVSMILVAIVISIMLSQNSEPKQQEFRGTFVRVNNIGYLYQTEEKSEFV